MFYKVLASPAKKRKVVVFLDSLDQLDPSNDARKVTWIRTMLPPNVKLIVSTLEEEKYEVFPSLKVFDSIRFKLLLTFIKIFISLPS